jgi:trans-aconitate methyltransferase
MKNIVIPKSWDASLYQEKHAFVWQYGEELLQILNPQPGERILDLGCGTGQLTEKIAQTGAETIGIDNSPSMIEKAKQNFPQLRFEVGDGRSFQVDNPLDAVFSNAVLHWIKEASLVINSVQAELKSGGRFVVEFGGKGNVNAITQALSQSLEEIGVSNPVARNPWYYPSIGEYACLLEQHGFDVNYAVLFSRPTSLTGGDKGIANWIEMFASNFLTGLTAKEKIQVIQHVENKLKPTLYQNGSWIADYRRIRIVAINKKVAVNKKTDT